MRAEKIIYSMNDIKDDYIIEYAEKEKATKVKTFHFLRTWGIIAACLALMIIFIPTLLHPFRPSEIDDPRAGARYEFNNYNELCGILPEGNIIANVPNSKEADISAYVECPEGTTDFSDYSDYSYLNVDVSYDNGTGVSIFCVVKSEKTAKEDIENKPLLSTTANVSMTTISDYDVYYGSYENGVDKVNIAEFSCDGSLYEFSTVTYSQEELIQYISDMLNP